MSSAMFHATLLYILKISVLQALFSSSNTVNDFSLADQGKTVTFAEQPMLYRFLQSANYQRDKIIPTIPENADSQNADINVVDDDKYDDDFIDSDKPNPDDMNVADGEKYDYVFANGEKVLHRNYDHNLCVASNDRHKRNDTCNIKDSDYFRNNREYFSPPLCNKQNNRNFHKRKGNHSIPSLYNETQNGVNCKSNERVRCPSVPYHHCHHSAFSKSQSQNLAGQLSPNSEHGSEVWNSSCYDEDETTTEGSYILDHLDTPNSGHSHSRSYVLAPNEAFC